MSRQSTRTMTQRCSVACAVVVQTLFFQLDMRPTPSSSGCWLMIRFCLRQLGFHCHLLFLFAMMKPLLSSCRTFFVRGKTLRGLPRLLIAMTTPAEAVASTREGYSWGSPRNSRRLCEILSFDLRSCAETLTFLYDRPYPSLVNFPNFWTFDLSLALFALFAFFVSNCITAYIV